ncbi:MAG: ATP-binding protein, partial [Defluviitaleaceae bacterium]|nr:ATP-binding protein [Defluviitaleaceae bacterium]
DIEMISEGGASFRFIVGKYGSGKSFLLQTIRNYATAKGFAVADADLSPERRFAGTKGQGLATYKELMQNLSVKSKPDGGALPLVLEKWLAGIYANEKKLFEEKLLDTTEKNFREEKLLDSSENNFCEEKISTHESRAIRDESFEGGSAARETFASLIAPIGKTFSKVSPEEKKFSPEEEKKISATNEKKISDAVEKKIFEMCNNLEGMVNGFEFAKAIAAYRRAYHDNDAALKSNVIKWFRGEYVSRRDAKNDLDINFIITDENWYDFLKIIAMFLVGAGYNGLLVIVDELVNIFKIPNSITRANNYEKILTMYNDVLQGKAKHIGFLMGGTPQCIEDKYRGVFSYEALRSRLAEGHFSRETKDLTAPIIRLEMLTQEQMYVLVEKLRDIHANLFDYTPLLSHEDLLYFLTVEYNRVGAATHITPREIIRDFIELINILHQNPQKSAGEILGSNSFELAKGGLSDEEIHSEFTEFEL